jgi:hypothetical protein
MPKTQTMPIKPPDDSETGIDPDAEIARLVAIDKAIRAQLGAEKAQIFFEARHEMYAQKWGVPVASLTGDVAHDERGAHPAALAAPDITRPHWDEPAPSTRPRQDAERVDDGDEEREDKASRPAPKLELIIPERTMRQIIADKRKAWPELTGRGPVEGEKF